MSRFDIIAQLIVALSKEIYEFHPGTTNPHNVANNKQHGLDQFRKLLVDGVWREMTVAENQQQMTKKLIEDFEEVEKERFFKIIKQCRSDVTLGELRKRTFVDLVTHWQKNGQNSLDTAPDLTDEDIAYVSKQAK